MDAIILAGGLGKRLYPLTQSMPKALAIIKGKPIIMRVIDELPKEITRIVVVIGYLGEKIKDTLGEEYAGKVIEYAKQEEQLGTLDALRSAKAMIQSERFLVLNADDLITRNDVEEMLKYPLAWLVATYQLQNPYGVCEADENDIILKIIEKPKIETCINNGVYLLDRQIFNIEVKPASNGEYYLPLAVKKLAENREIRAVVASAFDSLTSPSDHERLNR